MPLRIYGIPFIRHNKTFALYCQLTMNHRSPSFRCYGVTLFRNYGVIYDCAYCINRKSNDVQRAAFTVEVVGVGVGVLPDRVGVGVEVSIS